jgi:radical SAM protein with 4Fe4S-binding SPASM domain
MCLVRYAPTVSRRQGALSYEQFLELVDELPELRRLTLQGLGEPLLSPHLLDMVQHATERGIDVGFNTNATLLDADVAGRLIELGLGWLHVSLDGATAATYEDVRHGTGLAPRPGQFDRVVENLRTLLELRRRAGTCTPRVDVVFVAMRRNVHELSGVVDLGASLGVDEVWVQNLSHSFSDTDPAGAYAEIRRYAHREALFGAPGEAMLREAFRAAASRAAEVGVALRLPALDASAADRDGGARLDGRAACSWPWESAYVTHRGDVQPCCMVMGSDRARLGELRGRSFADIWHGEDYRDFRSGLLGADPPDVCRGCSQYRGLF